MNNGIVRWKDISNEYALKGLMSVSKAHHTKPYQALLYMYPSITETNVWRYDYARFVNTGSSGSSIAAIKKPRGSIRSLTLYSAYSLEVTETCSTG